MNDASSESMPDETIGYVVKRFPRLSETFIINELRALTALGRRVEVFSLTEPEPRQQAHLLSRLDLPVHYLPGRDALDTIDLQWRNFARQETGHRSLRKCIKVGNAGDSPFPGKRPTQAAALQMQAAALASLAAARGVAHLHAHFASDAATVAMLCGRLAGLSWSMTAHAKDIFHTYSHPQSDQSFLRCKLLEASFTVTVSDYNRRYLQGLAGGDAVIHRLYNGVDLTQLTNRGEPRESGLIVAVGRLVEKKGFEHLISACGLLRQRGVGFRCIIIGEGPQEAALAQRIETLGLDSHCQLIGVLPQNEVLDWLARALMSVLPCVVSRSGDRDGLPTVLLEAMALGTPVVSTMVAGIPEMIDDGVEGRLVPAADPETLADALEALLGMNADERQRMGRRARQKVERHFDLHKNARALNALFSTRSAAMPQGLQGVG